MIFQARNIASMASAIRPLVERKKQIEQRKSGLGSADTSSESGGSSTEGEHGHHNGMAKGQTAAVHGKVREGGSCNSGGGGQWRGGSACVARHAVGRWEQLHHPRLASCPPPARAPSPALFCSLSPCGLQPRCRSLVTWQATC